MTDQELVVIKNNVLADIDQAISSTVLSAMLDKDLTAEQYVKKLYKIIESHLAIRQCID